MRQRKLLTLLLLLLFWQCDSMCQAGRHLVRQIYWQIKHLGALKALIFIQNVLLACYHMFHALSIDIQSMMVVAILWTIEKVRTWIKYMACNETLDDTHASLCISSSHSHCIFSLDHVTLSKILINRLIVCGESPSPIHTVLSLQQKN